MFSEPLNVVLVVTTPDVLMLAIAGAVLLHVAPTDVPENSAVWPWHTADGPVAFGIALTSIGFTE
jgi:hypothetical protein